MAHSPIYRADSFDPSDPLRSTNITGTRSENYDSKSSGLPLSLMDLASTLSAHGGGALSADLALDLVLNDIVEQARLATNATAAAIALAQGEEIVCRATTGTNAPDLGVRLDAHSGLSGASVQTRTWQRCNDTEADPRVSADVCRSLGVRSILVYPVLRSEELLGVIEIFSARPNAFSDREVQTLEALAREVISNLDRAAEASNPTIQPGTTADDAQLLDALSPPLPNAILDPGPTDSPTTEVDIASPVDRRDPWTTLLMLLIIALAVVLGWMLGHGNRQQAKRKPGQTQVAANSQARPSQVQQPRQANNPAPPSASDKPGHAADSDSSAPRSARTAGSAEDLVVYQNGRVIFQMPASAKEAGASESQAGAASLQTPAGTDNAQPAVTLAPEVADQYLTSRVEPEYPEPAREQHIQGPVVLQAFVGKDGAVASLTTMSGDPALVAAATDAVHQWRFKPLLRNGHPVEFQTRITVSFRLP